MSVRPRLQLFAVAAPGLEAQVEDELLALLGPASAPQIVPGGVEFGGDERALMRANLGLRCASRLLLRCGTVPARDFATLRRGLSVLALSPYLPVGASIPLSVHVSSERCRLYHTVALAECLAEALTAAGYAVRLQDTDADSAESPDSAAGAVPSDVGLWLRGEGDRFTLSLDTSGALLHLRGYRKEAGPAPLRETLAAGLLSLSGYRGQEAFCDPLCGSGTLVIEAALRARRRAPGLGRAFAFQRWPIYQPTHFAELLAGLQANELDAATVRAQAPLRGSDCDPSVLSLARRNAERAGVADLIDFAVADVGVLRLPPAPSGGGLVLTNPPYGRRLGDRELGALYRKLARLVRSGPGWRLAVLTSQPALARLALRQPLSIPLRNGGLKVALYLDRRHPATALSDGVPSVPAV